MTTTAFSGAAEAVKLHGTPVLELRNIVKRFGAVAAVNNVSLSLYPGECVVLLGENGAGKSTLVGTILGRHRASEGEIKMRGEVIHNHNTLVARDLGIRAVTQEFNLCESLSVAANLYLGCEASRGGIRRKRNMRNQAATRLKQLDAEFRPTDLVADLTRAEQQLVEICKAVTEVDRPGVILLDEPTAAIGARESEKLFAIVDNLKAAGWAVLYISHRLEELRRVGDRVVVLRDGAHIATHGMEEVSDSQLITEMAGRELNAVFPAKAGPEEIGPPVLTAKNLATTNGKVLDVSFEIRAGEILGLGGLVGSGKGDVGASLFGISPLQAGVVTANDRRVRRPSAPGMYRRGFGYLAEDRRRQGILPETSVGLNVLVERIATTRQFSTLGLALKRKIGRRADELVREFDVRPSNCRRFPIIRLSGGNQQKALVARALSTHRKALIALDPTAGVDIGSRMDIYRQLRARCRDAEIGILLISSDVDELVGMCDRVLVMHAGRVAAELREEELNAENVVAASFGSIRKGTM